MVKLSKDHKDILQRYNRPIVHMRNQVKKNRFGLIFGAGMSKAFQVPTWEELVELLSKDPNIKGTEILATAPPRAALPYRTEMLFEHYKKQQYQQNDPDLHHTRYLDYTIGADWRGIIRKHLYANISPDFNSAISQHEYFLTYLPLIKRSQITVTYNFDDFIERVLSDPKDNRDTRGFETVTNPCPQFRRTDSIIYHPNGVIPQNPLETPSDRFVFSETSYAEQLIGIHVGDQPWLVNHLSKHTCLLIGLSLEDDILRSILMQSLRTSPGNFHYYVHYLKPGKELEEEERDAIWRANFKVYNLITLFLHEDEIRILGEVINPEDCPTKELCDFAQFHDIQMQFRFYITGPLGVGKTTTLNHFRNLVALDEWLGERLPILGKDWRGLTPEEKETADNWIADQFRKINDILSQRREGIFMLDRSPLDPFAFTPHDESQEKAERLLQAITNTEGRVEDGRVIFLHGDPEELALRMVYSQRPHYNAEKLENMEKRIGEAYGTDGITNIDTFGLSPSDVAGRVAEIVHWEQYEEVCDIHERLKEIQERGINGST